MSERWLTVLTCFQVLALLWLVASQILFAVFFSGGHLPARTVHSTLLLLAALIPILIYLPVRNRTARLWFAVPETVLVSLAAMNGSVAGFQLLILITVAKTGLVLESVQWCISALIIAVVYFGISFGNSQLMIQSSSGFSASGGIAGTLLGRELPTLLCGGALVFGIVSAAKAERNHRVELENLSEKLSELSAELERSRILAEIRSALEGLLGRIHNNVGLIQTTEAMQTEEKLSETRELAGEALTSIRSALKLLRRVEPER